MKKIILLIIVISTLIACVNLDTLRFTDFKLTTNAHIADEDAKRLIEDVTFTNSFEQPVLDQQIRFKLFWDDSFYVKIKIEEIKFSFSLKKNGVSRAGTFSTLSFSDFFNAIYEDCHISLFLTGEDISENQYAVTMANLGSNSLKFNSGVTKVFNFLE